MSNKEIKKINPLTDDQDEKTLIRLMSYIPEMDKGEIWKINSRRFRLPVKRM